MADRVGEKFGNYRLVRPLGKGGFADVYLGQHIHLDSFVAVKILLARMMEHEQGEFLHEARLIASLEHPSIVRVLDCGIEHDTAFLIMNYAPHGTLRQRHPKGDRLDLIQTLSYARQVTSALHYAHSRRIIHRDVKPENMLLGLHDEILLSDFGIALISASSSSQSTQATAGTISYMAPEQVLGKPRLASDQYALGIVIYEWLCGERPFQGSFSELCAQHLYATPPPLTTRNPNVPPAIEAVVMRALAKQPHERFPSIQEFMQALEIAGAGQHKNVIDVVVDAPEMKPFWIHAEDSIPTLVKSAPPSQVTTGGGNQPGEKGPMTPLPFPDQLERAIVDANSGDSHKETLLPPTLYASPRVNTHVNEKEPDSGVLTGTVTQISHRNRTLRRLLYSIPVAIVILALIGGSLLLGLQHFSNTGSKSNAAGTASSGAITPATTPQGTNQSGLHSPTSTRGTNQGSSGKTTASPTTTKTATNPTAQATTPVTTPPSVTPTATATKTTPPPTQISPTLTVSQPFRVNNFTGCQWDSHGGVGQAPDCPYTLSNATNANGALNWSVTSNNSNVRFSASNGTLAPGQSVTITILDLSACPITDTFQFRGNSNTVQASMICTAITASPDSNTFDNTWCTHNSSWSCVIQITGSSGNSQNTPWSVSLQTPDSKITFSQSQGTLAPGASTIVTINIPSSDCPGNNQIQFIVPGSLPNGSSWLNWSC